MCLKLCKHLLIIEILFNGLSLKFYTTNLNILNEIIHYNKRDNGFGILKVGDSTVRGC